MNLEPVTIEVVTNDNLVLRGYEWPTRGAPLLLLHDYGEDLDVWRDLDRALAEKGFRVINLELRGHGLSDGNADFNTVLSDIETLLKELTSVWGPMGLCTYGNVATTLCFMESNFAPAVQITLSPTIENNKTVSGRRQTTTTSHLVISGTGDKLRTTQARLVFDALGQNKLWASVASTDAGPKLLRGHRHLMGDISLFLQRYLVPTHLTWQKTALDQAMAQTSPPDLEHKE